MADADFDVAVVGGGVVGLAALHHLAAAGLNAVLFERHDACGRETSSRNSEVIHGGMYYAPGSLKARLCVAGRRRLVRFAEERGVPFRLCGKVIVAVDDAEVAGLERILATGRENGVEDLRLVSGAEVARMHPGVRAVAGLHSPATGVVNAHAFMDALQKTSEDAGAMIVRGAEVVGLETTPGGWRVAYRDAEGPAAAACRVLVNAAGLGAQRVMAMAGMDPEAAGLGLHPCKGNYFSVSGESRKRVTGLIYPAPEANLAGLGIHTIVDFAGGVKLGPDVEYVPEADPYDYRVDPSLAETFFASAARYLPFLRPEDIQPDMSGVRPKLSGPGRPARDFHIAEESGRGFPGLVNLAGIESPGLTASLAIGDLVLELARGA